MIYRYYCSDLKCEDYQKIFEIKQNIKDDKLKVCKTCKNETLEKTIEAPFFKLTGIGNYKSGSF